MLPVEIETARRDMLLWSVPIIADCTFEHFARLLGALHISSRVIAATHARFWRAVLRGEHDALEEARGELINLARQAGLERADIDAVDQLVLDELLHVVVERFTRSPQLMQGYARLLLNASADLAQARLAVAA